MMKMITEKLMKQDKVEDHKDNKKYKNKDSIYILLCMFYTTQVFLDYLILKTLRKNWALAI